MIDIRAWQLATMYPAYYPTTGGYYQPLVDEPDPELLDELMEAWEDYLEMDRGGDK